MCPKSIPPPLKSLRPKLYAARSNCKYTVARRFRRFLKSDERSPFDSVLQRLRSGRTVFELPSQTLRGLRLRQCLELVRHVDRGHAPQLAVVFGIVERGAAMHGREVVPDDEVAGAPFVAVDV